MKINIKATGIELTPAITSYAEKRVLSLEKYLTGAESIVAQVEVGKTTKHHRSGEVFRAEVHLSGAGTDLYAVSEKDDLYAAIDEVKDELAREIEHSKGKRSAIIRKSQKLMKKIIKGLSWGRRSDDIMDGNG